MKYQISGTMNIRPKPRPFTKVIVAESQKIAIETLYADIGSKHRLKRTRVKIIKVEEVK
ncbi:MAG: 50S ribosomal protein L18Ae [Candidatus Micrarchaeota archaeon]